MSDEYFSDPEDIQGQVKSNIFVGLRLIEHDKSDDCQFMLIYFKKQWRKISKHHNSCLSAHSNWLGNSLELNSK